MSQETRRKLSGDEVVALSREIQAMIAAGVPLDFGLKQAGKGMAAELGETSQRIGNRLESGQSLDDALRAEPSRMHTPRVVSPGTQRERAEPHTHYIFFGTIVFDADEWPEGERR